MKYISHLLSLVLGFGLLFSPSTEAAPTKNQPVTREVPTRLESLSKKKDAILHQAPADANTLIYYLYHIDCNLGTGYSEKAFKTDTAFIAETHQKLAGTAVGLILHITRDARQNTSAISRMAAESNLPCTIVNNSHRQIRKLLFQNATSQASIQRLRAVDSNGNLLAYFSLLNDSIIMYDVDMNTRQVLQKGGFVKSQWEAVAISASYDKLVSRVKRRELAARVKAKTKAQEEPEAAEKPKKKASRKPKANKSKPKRPEPMEDEDDFADEDDDFAEDDGDEEEDDDDFLDEEDL